MHYSLVADIEAPPERVWPLFVDLEHWPTMTASIREVYRIDAGPLRLGSEAIVRQPRLPPMRWRVIALSPGHSFTWETTSAGVTTTGGHIVEARGDGSTVTLTLAQRGLLAGAVNAILGSLTRKYLSMELEGFRRAAESQRFAVPG
jgi:uncharacterized membrane protein